MRRIVLLIALLLVCGRATAQNTGTGIPAFGSFTNGGFDTINNQNLNTYIAIPIAASAGRGMPLSLALVYNSLIWQKVNGSWAPATDSSGNPTWGWQKDFPAGGSLSYSTSTHLAKCGSNWAVNTTVNNVSYKDVLGSVFPFPINYTYTSCTGSYSGTTAGNATNASGYYGDGISFKVITPAGVVALNGTGNAGDANGNYVTKTINSGNSSEADWTDSVGNIALKITYNTSPASITYQFLDGTATGGVPNYQTITLKLQSLSIKTNFGCSNVTEFTGTATVPSEMDIPTPAGGTLKYLFSYEPTPQNSGYYTGRLQEIQLPTGGYYEYAYGTTNDGINCSDGTTLSMNREVSDTVNAATWNFVRNTSNSTTTVTTPQLADTLAPNDTVITFNSSGHETVRQIYSNSPGTNLQRTINTTWASNGTPATQITILQDATPSIQSEVDTTIDSNGLLDSMSEYDWGTGSRGALLRTTTLTYNTSTNYTSRNIIDLVTSKIITDAHGAVKYRQNITYDGVTLGNCPPGALQHDDTNYPCTMNYRGNPTSVTTYITPATSSGPVTKNFSYDFFGNLITAQLNCCQQKTWTYTAAANQYSEPYEIQSGTSPTLATYFAYNAYTGQVQTSEDPNNQTTTFYYDFLRRLIKTVRPDGAQITTAYDDAHFTTTATAPLDSSRTVQQIVVADTLGRPVTTTVEDASNNVYSIVQTNYDLAGRAYRTSNPYTSSPQYWTTASFDALGRTTAVTAQDNSQAMYSYSLQTVTVTDPAGKQRESVVDGAGRLLTVYEPDVTTQGNPLTVPTTYTYDVLDDLTKVASGSLQSRAYGYDGLGRLTSSTTPEAGQVQFAYDNFDNLTQRTDARNVVTNYSYDGLNRLAGVAYTIPSGSGVQQAPNSSTPNTVCNPAGGTANSNVCFYYDQGGSSAYALGQLTEMVDPSGSETYSYNLLGEETQLQKVIGTTTYTTLYAYNLAGELTQAT